MDEGNNRFNQRESAKYFDFWIIISAAPPASMFLFPLIANQMNASAHPRMPTKLFTYKGHIDVP